MSKNQSASFSQKTVGAVGSATKWALMVPFRWAVPPNVIKQSNMLKTRPNAPICPNCGLSELKLKDKEQVPGDDSDNFHWACGSCKLDIAISQDDLDGDVRPDRVAGIKLWLSSHAREVYENGYTYKNRINKDPETQKYVKKIIGQNVADRVLYSRALACLSLMIFFAFLWGLLNGKVFFTINSFLLTFLTLFMGIIQGYRAWQLHTDKIFQPNAKEQFLAWLKQLKWFKNPSVVGTEFLKNNSQQKG